MKYVAISCGSVYYPHQVREENMIVSKCEKGAGREYARFRNVRKFSIPHAAVITPPHVRFVQDLEQNSMTAAVLSDALPFIQAHADRTIVIKYGGHAMEDEEASLSFAQDVVMLKQVLRYLVWPLLSRSAERTML